VDPKKLNGADREVKLGVRPEKLRLYPNVADGLPPNTLTGTVTDASFIGVSTQYLVATDQIGEISVVSQNLDDDHHVPGDKVTVGWQPDHAFVVT
jgi:spermidine/putrescine transport system ATP-binding protein